MIMGHGHLHQLPYIASFAEPFANWSANAFVDFIPNKRDALAISINSASPVTRYTPAEILVSALWPGHRYIAQKNRQVTAGGPKI
jgi:hypothetical protein